MRTTTVLILLACSVSAAWAESSTANLIGESNPLAALAGNRFEGLWYFEFAPGNSPIVMTLSRGGEVDVHTSVDKGAYLPFELSHLRGVWRRTGGRTAEAIALRFTYNLDGTIRQLVRVRAQFQFGADFDTLGLEFTIDQINCETVANPPGEPEGTSASCPDPRTAPADASREGRATAFRVPFGAGL